MSFPLKGRRYIGYVPSQFLGSLYIINNENRYVLVVEKFINHKFLLTLKILNNFNLITNYSFFSPANDGYSPNEKDEDKQAMSGFMKLALFNNKGLDSINNILKLSTGVEACGYWYGQKYLLLKNNRVINELEDGFTSDADIYYIGYKFIFPSDSLGEKQKLLKKYWDYELSLDEKFEETWDALARFKWENYKLTKLDSTYKSDKKEILR